MGKSTRPPQLQSTFPTTVAKFDIDPETGAVLIPLGGKKYPGRFALVDPQDVPLISGYRWYAAHVGPKSHDTLYALSRVYVDGRWTTAYMHRVIVGVTDRHVHVDHRNHNGLDNRRANLRPGTHQQNHYNRKANRGSSSRYKGVMWRKDVRRWVAYIRFQGKLKHLGYFDDEREAAEAYDGAALMLFGSFALLNFPDESEVR